MWLPAIISALFTVSIDMSLGLVWLQIASSTGCAASSSSTDRAWQNAGFLISERCVLLLDSLLGAVESWGVVMSTTWDPAVPVLSLSLSSDLGLSPFFEFLSPVYRVDYWTVCSDIVLTNILPFLQRLLDKLICFLANTKGVDPSWHYHSWNSLKEASP